MQVWASVYLKRISRSFHTRSGQGDGRKAGEDVSKTVELNRAEQLLLLYKDQAKCFA
jgi:hypothetical protein